MVQLDGAPQDHQQLRGESRPALAEKQVVSILEAQPGGLLNEINRLQQLLQVQKPDIPGKILVFENGLQRPGGVAVSTTRIVKNNREVAHRKLLSLKDANTHECRNRVLTDDQSFMNFL